MAEFKEKTPELKSAPAEGSGPSRLENLPQYEVVRKLGEGGMGEVYCVRDLETGDLVAVKMLKPGIVKDPAAQKRFEKEVEATSSLAHNYIARVLGCKIADDGSPYLLMEYVDGAPLSSLLEGDKALPPQRALPIFLQIAEALAHAHAQGVVHRDLKPGNILIVEEKDGDKVKLVDFGIAKIMTNRTDVTKLTQTGEMIGSPRYMCPEQCTGAQIDERSDIYSMGCVFYEALAGEPLYGSENPIQVLLDHVQTSANPALKKLEAKGVPQAYVELLRRMLEKKPQARYQSMSEVVNELNLISQNKAPQVLQKKRANLLAVRLLAIALIVVVSTLVAFFMKSSSPPSMVTVQQLSGSPPDVSKPYVVKPTAEKLEMADFSPALTLAEKSVLGQKLNSMNDHAPTIEEYAKFNSFGKRAIPYLVEEMGKVNHCGTAGLILSQMGPDAIAPVVAAVKNGTALEQSAIRYFPFVRQQTMDGGNALSLGSIRYLPFVNAQAIDGIATLLLDADPAVRQRAAKIMAFSVVRANAHIFATGIPFPLSRNSTQIVLWTSLNDKDAEVRASAATMLAFAPVSAEVTQALQYIAIKDISENVQAKAVWALTKALVRQNAAYNKSTLEVLNYLLRDEHNQQIQKDFLAELTHPGRGHYSHESELIPLVKPLLNSRSLEVRNSTMDSLVRMDPKPMELLDDLVVALDQPECRDHAACALASYGPKAQSALPKLLKLKADPHTDSKMIEYAITSITPRNGH